MPDPSDPSRPVYFRGLIQIRIDIGDRGDVNDGIPPDVFPQIRQDHDRIKIFRFPQIKNRLRLRIHHKPQVIYQTGYRGLDIITSNLELYAADRALYDRKDTDTARVLFSALDYVRNDYDFCIIDNGPSVDTVTLNVLAAADDVLIPIRPDEFSFSGLLDLVEQVDGVRAAVNPGLTLRGAFFTHWQNRETFAQARRSLEDSGICPVLQTAISYNPKVPESTLEEKPLCVFAPRSWAAIQYKKLTAEYLALAAHIPAQSAEACSAGLRLTDSSKRKEG